jgi:hypothetical protein
MNDAGHDQSFAPIDGPVPREFLPRSPQGRIVLLMLSVGAVAFAGMMLFAYITGQAMGAQGNTWGTWLIRMGVIEFSASLLLTGSIGIVWSLATPRWLLPFAFRVVGWMAICLFIPWLIMIGLWLWPAWFGMSFVICCHAGTLPFSRNHPTYVHGSRRATPFASLPCLLSGRRGSVWHRARAADRRIASAATAAISGSLGRAACD